MLALLSIGAASVGSVFLGTVDYLMSLKIKHIL